MQHDNAAAEDVIKYLKACYAEIKDPRYKLMIRFMIATEPFCCRIDGILSWIRKRSHRG